MKAYIVWFLIPSIFVNKIRSNPNTITHVIFELSFASAIEWLRFYFIFGNWSIRRKVELIFDIFIFNVLYKSIFSTHKRRCREELRTIKIVDFFMNYWLAALLLSRKLHSRIEWILFNLISCWIIKASFDLRFIRITELISQLFHFKFFQHINIILTRSRGLHYLFAVKTRDRWRKIRNVSIS